MIGSTPNQRLLEDVQGVIWKLPTQKQLPDVEAYNFALGYGSKLGYQRDCKIKAGPILGTCVYNPPCEKQAQVPSRFHWRVSLSWSDKGKVKVMLTTSHMETLILSDIGPCRYTDPIRVSLFWNYCSLWKRVPRAGCFKPPKWAPTKWFLNVPQQFFVWSVAEIIRGNVSWAWNQPPLQRFFLISSGQVGRPTFFLMQQLKALLRSSASDMSANHGGYWHWKP